MKKRLGVFAALVLTAFIGIVAVKAAQQYYTTTLNMSGNTYLVGSPRNYTYSKFKIMGNVVDRDPDLSKQKLYMKLYKVNWLGNETFEGEGTSDYANKAVYGYDFQQTTGSGKKYLYFKTRSANDWEAYGRIESTTTYLVSYN